MCHFDQLRNESGRRVIVTATFGPAYDKRRDGARLNRQHERIRDFMLARCDWKTLAELSQALGYPESSVSAQLRHLRKKRFGAHLVLKRRRNGKKGTWEYSVLPPEKPTTLSLFDQPTREIVSPT
jgi:hypothetical protein